MARGFFRLLADSWKGFKSNFKSILLLFILLSVIPSLILAYVGSPSINLQNPLSFYQTSQGIAYLILGFLFNIITALFSAAIIVLAFSNKKLGFKEAISSGSKYWIPYVLLTISLVIAAILLTLPAIVLIFLSVFVLGVYFVIPGLLLFLIPVYFIIKWILSIPILIGENKYRSQKWYSYLFLFLLMLVAIPLEFYIFGSALNAKDLLEIIIFGLVFLISVVTLLYWLWYSIGPSIKRSSEVIKGKFWRTVLYLILLVILLIIIILLFSAIGYYLNVLTGNGTLATNPATGLQSVQFTTPGFLIQQIFTLAASLITTPMILFFLRNLYSEYSGKK